MDWIMDACACIGPVHGEPYCYCEMRQRGLPLNEQARAEDKRKLEAALDKLFAERKESGQ
jgi:hypothetical protein